MQSLSKASKFGQAEIVWLSLNISKDRNLIQFSICAPSLFYFFLSW